MMRRLYLASAVIAVLASNCFAGFLIGEFKRDGNTIYIDLRDVEIRDPATFRPPIGTSPTSTDCDDSSEAGRVFVDTDAVSGQQLYVCEGASGWILQGDGQGAGSAVNILEAGSSSLLNAGAIDFDGDDFNTSVNGTTVTVTIAYTRTVSTHTAQTLTNKTLTSPTINSPVLSADSIDAITEIASALKSGLDGTLVTGTSGTSGNCAEWDANGDLIDAGAACGSGGGGAAINILENGSTEITGAAAIDVQHTITNSVNSSTAIFTVNRSTHFNWTGPHTWNSSTTFNQGILGSTFSFTDGGRTFYFKASSAVIGGATEGSVLAIKAPINRVSSYFGGLIALQSKDGLSSLRLGFAGDSAADAFIASNGSANRKLHLRGGISDSITNGQIVLDSSNGTDVMTVYSSATFRNFVYISTAVLNGTTTYWYPSNSTGFLKNDGSGNISIALQVADTEIADGAVDGGSGGEIADGSVTADDLGTDSVSADELNASGVASELEAVLTLDNLQGDLSANRIAAGAMDADVVASSVAVNTVGNIQMQDNAITSTEMADDDHGDVSWTSNVATVDNVAAENIASGVLGASVLASSIAVGSVYPSALSATNSPSDGQHITYDSGSGQFTWGTPSSGGGGSALNILEGGVTEISGAAAIDLNDDDFDNTVNGSTGVISIAYDRVVSTHTAQTIEGAKTFSTDITLDDGSGDSPQIRLINQTNETWRIYAENGTDDLPISVNTAGSTVTVRIENANSQGAASLNVEHDVTIGNDILAQNSTGYFYSIQIDSSTVFNGTTYYWPESDGSANQVLSTDGNGNFSWADDATGGSSGGADLDINEGVDSNVETDISTITFTANHFDVSNSTVSLASSGLYRLDGSSMTVYQIEATSSTLFNGVTNYWYSADATGFLKNDGSGNISIASQVSDTEIADGAVDGGSGGEIADGSITADDLGTDSVSADELNASGVASELEAVLTLDNLQGNLSANRIAAGAMDADVVASSVAINTIGTIQMQDADHGDFTYSSGNATLDADTVDTNELADGTLDALSAYNTNGLLTQTAADTFTGRTITAGDSSLSISNGDGVSGNPTLSAGSNMIQRNSTFTVCEFISASAFASTISSGIPDIETFETSTNYVNYDYANLPKDTTGYFTFQWTAPTGWNASTFTYYAVWSSTSGSPSDGVSFELQSLSLDDDEAIDASYGTAVNVTDTLTATGDMHRTAASTALTAGGTPAANEIILFKGRRDLEDNSNDTLADNIMLLGLDVCYDRTQLSD